MTSDAFLRFRLEGRTFFYKGHLVFYRVEGEGPVLLLVHGFPSASWDFQPMWSALTRRFRVVAADMLGFGWSDKPSPYPYSILDQATLEERLLGELGVDEAHVLAHDYGDTVAQERPSPGRAQRTRARRSACIRFALVLSERRPLPRDASRAVRAEGARDAARSVPRQAHDEARFRELARGHLRAANTAEPCVRRRAMDAPSSRGRPARRAFAPRVHERKAQSIANAGSARSRDRTCPSV